jgi:hypothetical protein
VILTDCTAERAEKGKTGNSAHSSTSQYKSIEVDSSEFNLMSIVLHGRPELKRQVARPRARNLMCAPDLLAASANLDKSGGMLLFG